MPHNAEMTAEISRKSTRQRSAIQATLAEVHRPLLPAEILALAQQAIPELGMATIYRNLKLLLEAGEIQSVELPGEAARYELAHRGHHHHFSCRQCHQVFDIPGCPTDIETFAPAGFAVEHHDLTLYGVCADCAGGALVKRAHHHDH
jgi:Fur family ferric uptake transcriptional regulator